MPKIIGLDEYLGLIAEKNLPVVLEHAVPRGKLKRAYGTIRAADGTKAHINVPGGLQSSSFELPIDTLKDYLSKGLLRESQTDAEGNTIFLLTENGLAQATWKA